MIEPIGVVNQLAFATVRLSMGHLENDEPKLKSHATGFIYKEVLGDENWVPAIVANRHILLDGDFIFVTFHRANESKSGASGKILRVATHKSMWVGHPDEKIDLAVLLIGPLFALAEQMKHDIFFVTMSESNLPTDEDYAKMQFVEPILMVGYPLGLYDEKHYYPLFRQGITATHPAVNFNGDPQFLTDITAQFGSSGSPVILYREFGAPDGRGGFTIGRGTIFLLGVQYKSQFRIETSPLKIQELGTQNRTLVSESQDHVNLGFAVRSSEIPKLIKHAIDMQQDFNAEEYQLYFFSDDLEKSVSVFEKPITSEEPEPPAVQ